MSRYEPLVNIVVRTFNEEDWIRSCLTRIFAQNYRNKVVTVVDVEVPMPQRKSKRIQQCYYC